MDYIHLTTFDLASRYIGVKEVGGTVDNPLILAMLKLDMAWPDHDEVPWCSGFMNWIAWNLRLPRSKSLLARSWLTVGRPIELSEAKQANDVVILKRGGSNQPGPDNHTAPGHVGLFGGLEGTYVHVLGGNQSDTVSIARYKASRVLGVRRLL